jgi:ABC-type branched-subunit amino acid transport system substrate-binding protein
VNGAPIEATYVGYNPLDDSSVRTMCQKIVDAKVLAVLAYGLFDTQVLCFTEEHGVPLINGIGFSDDILQRSRGLLFSAVIGKTRAGRTQVAELDRIGQLKGKKLGVLTSADRNDDSAAKHGIEATLEARGYKVEYEADLSSELQTGTAQIPVQVQQMQAHGVNAVFLAANLVYSGTFVQNAENQGYRPQYFTSDLSQMAEDGNTSRMSQSFDGAIGVSVLRTGEDKVNIPEPAYDAQCRQTYEAPGAKNPRGQLAYNTTMAMCSVVEMLTRGAAAAGSSLNARTLVAGLETLSDFPMAFEAAGSLGPGKHDAPVAVRTLRWHYDCLCYHPTGDFQPASR